MLRAGSHQIPTLKSSSEPHLCPKPVHGHTTQLWGHPWDLERHSGAASSHLSLLHPWQSLPADIYCTLSSLPTSGTGSRKHRCFLVQQVPSAHCLR